MHKLWIILVVFWLLNGCSSKEQKNLINTYQTNKSYHKSLQKTEKIQFDDGNETKLLLTATYLFTQIPLKVDKRDERFIVGIYDMESENGLEQNRYKLTLNGKEAKCIEPLTKDSIQLKDVSFVTQWGEYYLVTFPHVKAKSFKLQFESDIYGKGVMHFAKVAKYILSKKAF